ncbi:ATP phosphoribosyltransferase [Gonapodya prolifera JEL478]|uniref:ATP phosphoribosyltransferase n=1 Tax=Gonapodya prolifera (strain JEL478) TaxID=1344416 RepID=A0A139A5L8_GONPJ|nr:ATP phosphoribosyltransferase [Gonapodya prolifera JEL478]|eukprot:KXS12044.1 ATP phosphoribosyltransferase [Gonapodya prolifera JEL478]
MASNNGPIDIRIGTAPLANPAVAAVYQPLTTPFGSPPVESVTRNHSRVPSNTTFGDLSDLSDRLLFAVPKKGRLAELTLKFLEGADVQFNRKNRLDIALSTNLPVAVVFLPAADIPKYIADGNVDLGITGRDMIAEADVKLNEVLALGFGKCKLCVQVPIRSGIRDPKDLAGKRIVTSFENLAKKYFGELDSAVKSVSPTHIEYVSGSVEAACALGLADGIIDLVESGETMRAAGLVAIHTIIESETVLVSNPHTSKQPLIDKISNRIAGYVNAQRYYYCTYNAPKDRLKEFHRITPGKKAPTVTPLDDEDWVSVSAMVEKKSAAEIMDKLEIAGARDILLFALANTRV